MGYKKVLCLIMAVVFMFSTVIPVMAASEEATDAGRLLKDLGIIVGYEDGSLGLDKTITRAEMCVVLSKIAGMNNAANLLKDMPSKFSDVKASVWYTGYINLAKQQGWIAGYPDGTFRPSAEVTYAESTTMILNILGFVGSKLPGSWPQNYLVKASELGVTDGIVFSANYPAPRGDVFRIAEGALNVDYVIYDAVTGTFINDPGKTKPIDKFVSGVTGEITMDDAYMILGSSLKDESREVHGDKNYQVAEGFDIYPFIGIPTTFYLNQDGKIISYKDTKLGEVKTADMKSLSTSKLVLENGDSFNLAADTTVIINDDIKTSWTTVAGGTVSYLVNDANEVIYAKTVDYNTMDSALIEYIDTNENTVEINSYTGSKETFDLQDDQIRVYGVASELKDVKKNDVLYFNKVPNGINIDVALYAVRDTVSGKVDRYNTTENWIRVNGTNYSYDSTHLYISSDNGASFTAGGDSDMVKLSGESVIIYLDGYGDVYAVSADYYTERVAMIVHDAESYVSWGITVYRIDLFLSSGKHVRYYFDPDFDASDIAADYSPGDLVKYGLNDSNEIDAFKLYDGGTLLSTFRLDEDYTINYDRVQDGSGNKYYAVDDTVIINADPNNSGDYDDAELIKWRDVEDYSIGKDNQIIPGGSAYYDNNKNLLFIVFEEPQKSSGKVLGVFDSSWQIADEWYVGYTIVSGYREDKYDGTAPELAKGMIVEVSGIGEEVNFATRFTAQGTLGEDAYNSTRKTLTIDSTVYDLADDVLVVDTTGTDPKVISLADLQIDDKVMIYVQDDAIQVIAVVENLMI